MKKDNNREECRVQVGTCRVQLQVTGETFAEGRRPLCIEDRPGMGTMRSETVENSRMSPIASKLPVGIHRIIAQEARELGVTVSACVRAILISHASGSAASQGYQLRRGRGMPDSASKVYDSEDRHEPTAGRDENEELIRSPIPHEKRTRRDSQT